MTRFKNHRSEENRFKKRKEKDEKLMRENGMSEDKIKTIYNYDRMAFNSDRRFYEHILQPSDGFFEFICDDSNSSKYHIFQLVSHGLQVIFINLFSRIIKYVIINCK